MGHWTMGWRDSREAGRPGPRSRRPAGGRLEPGGDADGERVAADTGEVLAEQVSGSRGLAGGCGGDHFDVMAFQFIARPAGCWSGVPVRATRSATAKAKPGRR